MSDFGFGMAVSNLDQIKEKKTYTVKRIQKEEVPKIEQYVLRSMSLT